MRGATSFHGVASSHRPRGTSSRGAWAIARASSRRSSTSYSSDSRRKRTSPVCLRVVVDGDLFELPEAYSLGVDREADPGTLVGPSGVASLHRHAREDAWRDVVRQAVHRVGSSGVL